MTLPDEVATVQAYHPYATLGFSIPANTALVVVYGSVSPVNGPYSVNLVSSGSSTLNTSTPVGNKSYSNTSPWGAEHEVLYFATLDPSEKYSVEMEYIGPTGAGIGIGSADFVQVSGSV